MKRTVILSLALSMITPPGLALAASGVAAQPKAVAFTPPSESEIPDNEFGRIVRLGKNIFEDTQTYAKPYVGNGMNCVNCHLNAGRKPESAPLWGAYVRYPAYRAKNNKVNTYEERIQGCFKFSMNGKAPAPDSPEMVALVTYSYWLATGAPVGGTLKGAGFTELPKPASTPDPARGKRVYADNCQVCHGANGEGQRAEGKSVFPPLWGAESFNWGAGMHRINTAAAFIKANMPLSRGHTLTDQEAWDVATFVLSHERPQDPRFKGDVAQTKKEFHDENCKYGETVDGKVLGDQH
ncbi:MAG TPA: c-type cytochrome [Gallionellaceae bacterium]